MRKIKTILSYSKSDVDKDIQDWLSKDVDAQNINILSVNGLSDDSGYIITYILYEIQGDQGIQM
jgi:hypothetical protein